MADKKKEKENKDHQKYLETLAAQTKILAENKNLSEAAA
jgi:hypothetical protein